LYFEEDGEGDYIKKEETVRKKNWIPVFTRMTEKQRINEVNI